MSNNMNDAWTARWDDRFSGTEYAYGEMPNNYLAAQLEKLQPGTILFAAEGEGRNAVYAARNGWKVSAFDISEQGRRKAMGLAATHGVSIDYRIGELSSLGFAPGSFDAVALIYAHFPAAIKQALHRQLAGLLRPGGAIIFEAFSKDHLAYLERNEKVGGPREIAMLFSVEELKADFEGFEFSELLMTEVELHEGAWHDGVGSVIRCVARKPDP